MPAAAPERANARKVLVIDSNKFDQKRVERMLAKSPNMRPQFADTLSDAFSAVDASKFDLVVTNNTLPDGLGISFIRRLRRTATLAETPVLMIADHPTPVMQDSADQAGVSAVVAKADLHLRHFEDAMRCVPAFA